MNAEKLRPVEDFAHNINNPGFESMIPKYNFLTRFMGKFVTISLLTKKKISGKITDFNNFDVIINDSILISKHTIVTVELSGPEKQP